MLDLDFLGCAQGTPSCYPEGDNATTDNPSKVDIPMLKPCTLYTTGLHCDRAQKTHQKESDAVNILHEIDCPDIMLGYVA